MDELLKRIEELSENDKQFRMDIAPFVVAARSIKITQDLRNRQLNKNKETCKQLELENITLEKLLFQQDQVLQKWIESATEKLAEYESNKT